MYLRVYQILMGLILGFKRKEKHRNLLVFSLLRCYNSGERGSKSHFAKGYQTRANVHFTGVCVFLVVTIETAYSILVNLFSGTFSGTYFSGVSSSEPKASNFAMFSILAASTILIYGFIAL